MSSRTAALAVLVASLATTAASGACGGHELDVGSTDAGGPITPNGGIAATFDSPVCPAAPPTVGAPCSVEGAECEYGTRATVGCNDVLACRLGVWTVADDVGACHEPVGRACPASIPREPDNTGAQCPDDLGLVCYYVEPPGIDEGQEICFCHKDSQGTAFWDCETLLAPRECPWPRPHLGASCARPGTVCNIFGCWHSAPTDPPYDGVGLECDGRYWITSFVSANVCH